MRHPRRARVPWPRKLVQQLTPVAQCNSKSVRRTGTPKSRGSLVRERIQIATSRRFSALMTTRTYVDLDLPEAVQWSIFTE
jgi:hypothetical protein